MKPAYTFALLGFPTAGETASLGLDSFDEEFTAFLFSCNIKAFGYGKSGMPALDRQCDKFHVSHFYFSGPFLGTQFRLGHVQVIV